MWSYHRAFGDGLSTPMLMKAVEPTAGWLTQSDGISSVTVGLMPQIGPGRAGSPPPRAELRENRRV